MIVTAYGETNNITPEAVVEALAFKFEVDAASIRIRRSGPEEFIILVGDEATAARFATNSGPSSSSTPFRVHCRRWSRQAHAKGSILPCLVDVELHGVPAHTWEVSTAENLFNPFGWLKQVHPDTRLRLDYSAFKFSAWCFKLSDIPASRDLVVVEPVDLAETPPVKRALVYPVSFSVQAKETMPAPNRPTSPGGDSEEDAPRRRRRRGNSPALGRAGITEPAGSSRGNGPPRNREVPINSGPRDEEGSPNEASVIDGIPGGAGEEPERNVTDAIDGSRPTPPSQELHVNAGVQARVEPEEAAALSSNRAVQIMVTSAEEPEVAPSVDTPTLARFEVVSTPVHELEGSCQHELVPPVLGVHHSATQTHALEEACQQEMGPPTQVAQELYEPGPQVERVPHEPVLAATLASAACDSAACEAGLDAHEHTSERAPQQPDSPVTWLPAEDVLPQVPPIGLDAGAIQGSSNQPTRVYTRRPRAAMAAAAEPPSTQPAMEASRGGLPPTHPTQEFINLITKPLHNSHTTPRVQRRRRNQAATTQAPRRSWRIAKLPPEINQQAAVTVCRRLGFTDNQQGISEETMDKYKKFFNNPLSRNHVCALAALFGKEVPTEEELDRMATVVLT